MNKTHTPGPWTLQPIGDETECNVLGAGRELIATVSDNDAPLIAAAPNLLSALVSLEQAYSNKHSPQHRESCLAQARNAISKATGQA